MDLLDNPPARALRVGLLFSLLELYVGRLSVASLGGGALRVISTSSGLYATASRFRLAKPRPEDNEPPFFAFVPAADKDGNCFLSDGSAFGCGAALRIEVVVDGASFGSYLVAVRRLELKPRPEESPEDEESDDVGAAEREGAAR